MMTTAELRKALEALGLGIAELNDWVAADPALRLAVPAPAGPDASIRLEGETVAVTIAAEPRVEPSCNDPSAQRAAYVATRAFEQRRKVLTRLFEQLAVKQRAYFDGAAEAPRTLSTFAVAGPLAMIPSRVVQALRGKRIDTPRGIIAPSTLVDGATAAEGKIERVVAGNDPSSATEVALLRTERGTAFALVATAPRGWSVGDTVIVHEEQLSRWEAGDDAAASVLSPDAVEATLFLDDG